MVPPPVSVDLMLVLHTGLAQTLAPPPISVEVTEINGVPGGVYDVVVSITRTIGTSGDVDDVKEELRQGLAAFLGLEDVSAALDTEEMQDFGDFTLGMISTDLGDGNDPILESVARHVYCYVVFAIWFVGPSDPISPLSFYSSPSIESEPNFQCYH